MNGIGKAALLLLSGALIFFHGVAMAASDIQYYTEKDLAIPAIFKFAKPFSEGLAAVCASEGDGRMMHYKDEYYYITPEGKPAFTEKKFFRKPKPVVFKDADSFSEGLAAVRVEYKTGYIDKQGKMVIQPQYRNGLEFRNGKALVLTDGGEPWQYIDKEGKTLVTFGNWRFWGHAHAPQFMDGLALVSVWEHSTELHGFVDETGKLVIPMIYTNAQPFSEGLAAVQINDDAMNGWVYIDRDGNVVSKRRYYSASSYRDGLAKISHSTFDVEYIDKNGETVLSVPKEGILHRYGNTFERMLCTDEQRRRCGIQDMHGNWIIEAAFPPISEFSEGMARFEVIHRKMSYSGIRPTSEERSMGVGVINRKGEIVVPMGKYRGIDSYKHGIARVWDRFDERPYRYIDKSGNPVENPLIPVGEPSEGLQLVRNQDGRFGYVKAR